MLKKEFEELAGYKVSDHLYHEVIEPMYMATDLPKQTFVKVVDFSKYTQITLEDLVEKLRECAEHLKKAGDSYVRLGTLHHVSSLLENIDALNMESGTWGVLDLKWDTNDNGKPYPKRLYIDDDYYDLVKEA